jgi:sugar phosphate isomerase/epimerase
VSVRLTLAAITDEYGPELEPALEAMAEAGMTGVELRTIDGRNVVDLADSELDRIRATVEARGMRVVSIASPVFKCTLPSGPPVDERFQQDVFGSPRTFDDQAALIDRSFAVAARTGAGIIRVFSYWRTTQPTACFGAVASALEELAERADEQGLVIGIENEHACNVATGFETSRLLELVTHPALQVIWDPANALVAGEACPYPDGYNLLQKRRIAHVHAKDCFVSGHTPTWTNVGDNIDWRRHIRSLVDDGYRGAISLETHWKGPHGDKREASRLAAARLRAFVDEAVADS